MDSALLKDVFEWDVHSWGRSLKLWDKYLAGISAGKALDIGARSGGLSLLLAKEYGLEVICSDLTAPAEKASRLHSEYFVSDKITYANVDCTNITFPDSHFEVVMFKSVIGALGDFRRQQKAIEEMHRVLKPGGILLFAENLQASRLHMFLRNRFNAWSGYWRYPTKSEFETFLSPFSSFEIGATGFLATFVGKRHISTILSKIDNKLDPILPDAYKYIIYGAAIK